ncbi:molybdopterin-guanine dinucleotide biosynthesis protein MobB [Xenorhabdus anantnagensis]|uniref:Molybdopterin-guanine dinucleotide biosynthesis protein MobB n=1 Tax=Xenorhabdus anantnagensis TaxID=3025875 RepID=A0ABT5LUF3_9GAMM|nr:molybdopterin-guanine dinucleotide biosynthesis protein MobB [Xenorhabdus anantnagensis]MDC9598050.1 molybdopterin-guanine dinucleotide biosynthesis protein MobB [Xenorhabdus anantnagensis]
MNLNTSDTTLPILGITAYSGTGKTTLLKQVIPLLRQQHIRVGLIKHTHHNMDVDKPGKDSYELRKAGATQTLVASQQRWALMTETPDLPELNLYYLASRFDANSLDMILVEGFKQEPIPKIALYRDSLSRNDINRNNITPDFDEILDPYVLAIASDIPLETSLPQLDINQPEQITAFIAEWLSSQKTRKY